MPKPITVIVIEDNDLLRKSAMRYLSRWYDVVAFEDPHLALVHLEACSHHVVIVCDYEMPGLNGVEVYERLPELQSRFIFHSGAVVGLPTDRVVMKPSNPQNLKDAIEAVIAEHA